MKNKKILALTVSILLGIGTIGNSVAFADTATLTKNGEKKQERPQKGLAISAWTQTALETAKIIPFQNYKSGTYKPDFSFKKGWKPLKYPQNSILIMFLMDLEWNSSEFRVIFINFYILYIINI